MRESLERLLGKGREFPIEVTVASGDRYFIPHPDYATVHPNTGALIIFPEKGEFMIVVNPAQIVAIETQRKAS